MQTIRLYVSIIVGLSLCNYVTIDALTLTVNSPLDNGAGTLLTLREAIDELNLNGDPAGNMILFNLPGPDTTINLLSPLPTITKQVTIDGLDQNSGNRVSIIGVTTAVTPLAGLHFSTNAASNSTATNLIIQSFTNTLANGASYGILFDGGANHCSVTNCTIIAIRSAIKFSAIPTDSESIGIRSFGNMNIINNNETTLITSTAGGASSGNVAGIYVENNITNTCSNNLTNLIQSGDAPFSGFAYGISADTINGDCVSNIIASIRSGDGDLSGPVNGIRIQDTITQACSSNIIALITSGSTTFLSSGNAIGIEINRAQHVNDNITTQVTSGNSDTAFRSGDAHGIFLNKAERVNRNSSSSITSGSCIGGTTSGAASGITIELLTETCDGSLINIITSGAAPAQRGTIGIFIIETSTGVSISRNAISSITGNSTIHSSGTVTAGLYLKESSRPLMEENSITAVTGIDDNIHGMLLGCASECGSGPPPSVTNGNIFSNTISDIIGTMSNGFGISVLAGSRGNDILYTSVFTINGKAINIIDNGAPVDGIVQLHSIECCARCAQDDSFVICGTLEPAPPFVAKQFLIQLFVSTLNLPPQIETFIGEFTIQAFGNPTEFCKEFTPLVPLEEGQFITATATALTTINNNTSEVSNPLTVPQCIPPNICGIITQQFDQPDPFNLCGFISINKKQDLDYNLKKNTNTAKSTIIRKNS